MLSDLQEKINLLSSSQAWERQITAIELGDLGDLRAVIPLRNALKTEDVEEVIIAIEKALKRIAEQNGFESIEAMALEWERKEREIEELIERGQQNTITHEDLIQYLNMKITQSTSTCIESSCPFYLTQTNETPNLPQISKDHKCMIYHTFIDTTEQKTTIGWLLLLSPNELPLSLLQTKTCQNGYVFLRTLFETYTTTESPEEQEKLALTLLSLALQKNPQEIASWKALFSTFTTEQLIYLKKTINESSPLPPLLEHVNTALNDYISQIKQKYPALTTIIKEKKEQRKQLKASLDKHKKSLSSKLGFKKKAIQKEEKDLELLEQELKQLLTQRKQEQGKLELHAKQFTLAKSFVPLFIK